MRPSRPEVIDLVSSPEPEERPKKQLSTAKLTNGNSVAVQNIAAEPVIQDPLLANSRGAAREPERQNAARRVGVVNGRNGAEQLQNGRVIEKTAQRPIDPILAHATPLQQADPTTRTRRDGEAIGSRTQTGRLHTQPEERVRSFESFHAKEALRRTDLSGLGPRYTATTDLPHALRPETPPASNGHVLAAVEQRPALELGNRAEGRHIEQHGERPSKRQRLETNTKSGAELESSPTEPSFFKQFSERVGSAISRLTGTVSPYGRSSNEMATRANLFAAQAQPPLSPPRFVAPVSRPVSGQSNNSPAFASNATLATGLPRLSGTPTNHGIPYTPEEDALLAKLKGENNLGWDEIVPYFNGRTRGSLQVRYSSKLSGKLLPRTALQRSRSNLQIPPMSNLVRSASNDAADSSGDDDISGRRRLSRHTKLQPKTYDPRAYFKSVVHDEVVPSLESSPSDQGNATDSEDQVVRENANGNPTSTGLDRIFQSSANRLLRHRELGSVGGRGWRPSTRPLTIDFKSHVFDSIGPSKYLVGTSGDVNSVAWSPNGTHFAAGSIAVSDERSMQYNNPKNLLIGDAERGILRELPEHHVQRPTIDDPRNVNAEHSMQQSQDPRLFMTVSMVGFSPKGDRMYSAGSDERVRVYRMRKDIDKAKHVYTIEHTAPVDLITLSASGILATGARQSSDSIRIYRCKKDNSELLRVLSPTQTSVSALQSYPTALKWGPSGYFSDFLLAGFASSSKEAQRDTAGETALWDIRIGQQIELTIPTRNVFDVAWNPTPSAASSVFAVASVPFGNVSKGMRSVVRCFAPKQGKYSKTIEWECPAFDINDVVYCPHDDNLIAVGATDGRAYVWDLRFADRRNTPLHVLRHGGSLNVLDHDRSREEADTGVRFLSWGENSSRLFTGSSDGVLKLWNPYLSKEHTHVRDVAIFSSAIMSGAFSPDYRELLIGEDQGRVNLLSLDNEKRRVRDMENLSFHPAPAPVTPAEPPFEAAHELLDTEQIVIRPLSAMPSRQAVQGPKYRGPFVAPSADRMQAALDLRKQRGLEAEIARNSLKAAIRLRMASGLSEMDADSDLEDEVEAKGALVREAQDSVDVLYGRLERSSVLLPKAAALQQTFIDAYDARMALKVKLNSPPTPCQLPCAFMPGLPEEDGQMPDSGRSQDRIPSSMRIQYDKITAARAGLRARCVSCSAPARPSTDDPAAPVKCEKCDFACFRCSKPARVSPATSLVTCMTCGMVWEAGVLGYELLDRGATLGNLPQETYSSSSAAVIAANDDDDHDDEDLGGAEREHYASLWIDKSVS